MAVSENPSTHGLLVRRGDRLEYLTIGWNLLEAVIAIVAGLVAGSIALVGFGLDSVIEVASGPRCSGGCGMKRASGWR